METNKSGTASFGILAKTESPIDAVVRHSEKAKLDFPAIASVELGFSEKYGFQVILCAFGLEGKFPVLVQTDYQINRPRIEVAVPSAQTLSFLKQLHKNVGEAIKRVKAEEGRRLIQIQGGA